MSAAKRKELKDFAIRKQQELQELLTTRALPINVDMPGIYAIYCPITYKAYIGQAKNIKERWSVHQRMLLTNKHYNRKLQRAWNKFEIRLKFVVLEQCEPHELNDREHWYIKYYRTKIAGLNVKRGIKPTK